MGRPQALYEEGGGFLRFKVECSNKSHNDGTKVSIQASTNSTETHTHRESVCVRESTYRSRIPFHIIVSEDSFGNFDSVLVTSTNDQRRLSTHTKISVITEVTILERNN